jgi:nicotinamidase-related amidase
VAGTDPYPWPYDGALDRGRTALVIAGAQRWWARKTEAVADALDALARLRAAARRAGVPVLHIVHTGPAGTGRPTRPYLPAPGSADALPVLEPGAGDIVVPAGGQSGGFAGPLVPTLRAAGIDHVLVAGLGLEGPVHSTLRDLNDQGYECLLVADAASFDTPTTRDAAISSVTMSGGIFGAVGSTDAVVTALTAMEVSP